MHEPVPEPHDPGPSSGQGPRGQPTEEAPESDGGVAAACLHLQVLPEELQGGLSDSCPTFCSFRKVVV